jgi:hypothetical protein
MKYSEDEIERRAQVAKKHLESDEVPELKDDKQQPLVGIAFEGTRNWDLIVMTSDEADARADQYVRETVWATNSQWIADFTPDSITAEHIDAMRGDKCESMNEALTALIESGRGMDAFVEATIAADGRERFLSSYDDAEYEEDDYIIIRV